MHNYRMIFNYLILTVVTVSFLWVRPIFSQEDIAEKQDGSMDNMLAINIDATDFSLEELLNIEVEVASLFAEEELVVGSTVSSISSKDINRLGARRTHEALNNELNVINIPTLSGSNIVAIRGYTTDTSLRGVSWMLDGVPLNTLSHGTSVHIMANWELRTIDAIEMIKGPGSAIYGSDAFHGVIAMKTFEPDADHYSFGVSGAYPQYYDGNVKLSHVLGDAVRIDLAAGASAQGDQNIEYEWEEAQFGATGTGTYKNIYNSQSGVLKLRVNPNDKLKFKLGGYISNWKTEGYPGTRTLYGLVQRDKDSIGNEAHFIMGNGSITYDLPSDISIEASGFYWQAERTQKVQLNDTLSTISDISETEIMTKNIRNGGTVVVKQPDNPMNLQWVLGYSYMYMKIPETTRKSKSLSTGTWENFIPYTLEYDNLSRTINSVFIQFKWEAVEKNLYFIAGGRFDKYSDFGNQVTPRGGVIILPSKNDSVKALYGRAFRAAVGNELAGLGSETLGSKDINPEIIDIYELIYIHKGENWKLNINTFYSFWKDGIMTVANPDWPGGQEPYSKMYANEGESRSYGGEARIYYSLKPFAIDIGAAYTKSEALDVEDPLDSTKKIDLEYNAFPDFSGIIGLYYTLEPWGINFYLNNRIYSGMVEFPAAVRGTAPDNREPDTLDLYCRMDLNINMVVIDNLDITLDVRNMLNRENYVPSLWGNKNGIEEEPGIKVLLRADYKL